MAAHAFPVPTKQFAAEVQGVRTDFVLQGFDNRVLVIATQLGKVGTVLHARQDVTHDGEAHSFSVQTLLGRRDEPLLEVCARRLVEAMAAGGCRRPLLLTLGLQKHDAGTMKAILQLVDANKVW